MGKHKKACCNCNHKREQEGMIPFLDEGVRRYVCNMDCRAAYVIRKNAERSREERFDVT